MRGGVLVAITLLLVLSQTIYLLNHPALSYAQETQYVPVSVKVKLTGYHLDLVFTITVAIPRVIVLEPLNTYYVNVSVRVDVGMGGLEGLRYIDVVDSETGASPLRIILGTFGIGYGPEVYTNLPVYYQDSRVINFTAVLTVTDNETLIKTFLSKGSAVMILRPVFDSDVAAISFPEGQRYYWQGSEYNVSYIDRPALIYFVKSRGEASSVYTAVGTVTKTLTYTATKILWATRTLTIVMPYNRTVVKTVFITRNSTPSTTTVTSTVTATVTSYASLWRTLVRTRTVATTIYIARNITSTFTKTISRVVTSTVTSTATKLLPASTTVTVPRAVTVTKRITAVTTRTISELSQGTVYASATVLLIGLVTAVLLARR